MTSLATQTTHIEVTTASFDGHTPFLSLTYTQKLIWLSETAASIHILARCNPEAGCNRLFDPDSGIEPS